MRLAIATDLHRDSHDWARAVPLVGTEATVVSGLGKFAKCPISSDQWFLARQFENPPIPNTTGTRRAAHPRFKALLRKMNLG
jgi:hypothetical protein